MASQQVCAGCPVPASRVLRGVDLEDVRDADLGDVLAAGNPPDGVRRGVVVPGLSRVVLRVSR
jgi:hypothetical protein